LFLGLGLDFNVPPAELTRFQNEVTCTDDFWSIPGLIHYMTPNNLPVFSEAVSDTIVYWLRQPGVLAGINQATKQSSEIRCYPNPFSESVSISYPPLKPNSTVKISVVTPLGKEVFHAELQQHDVHSNTTLNLDFLPKGLYWVIVNADGVNVVSKVIKE
jgi:hypothetical protein